MTGEGPLRHLRAELARLEAEGLLRTPIDAEAMAGSPGLLVLCSNDYLGYAAEPWPAGAEDAGSPVPSGSGASRLVSGEHRAHEEAERAIAGWVGAESALLFSSGYAANVGTLAGLAGPGDLVVSDALNHASIIDGCRLSGATVTVVPHCDTAAVERALAAGRERRRRWVVTESYFSMDGDVPDLAGLRSLCDAHDAALIVDEAHALGVFGPRGAGLCADAGVVPDVCVGPLGKAVGLQGAFVAGPRDLRTYLWNKARSFVFSTGVSPAVAALVADRVRRVARDEERRRRLDGVSRRLREGLTALGCEVPARSRGPIIPWVVGSPTAAVELSRHLRDAGVLVQAIRPPTVPPDTSRLRITACALLTEADIERALAAVARVRA